MSSFEKLLSTAGVPNIWPSNEPSLDLTMRGAAAAELEEVVVAGEAPARELGVDEQPADNAAMVAMVR